MGDWNTPENEIMRSFENVFCSGVNANTGTRIVNGIQTTRKIDFMITSMKGIILDEKILNKWIISDHIPVSIILNIYPIKSEPKMKMIFDREKILKEKIKTNILKHKYIIDLSRTTSCQVENFTNEIKKKYIDNGIIRLEKNVNKIPCKKITKLVKLRAQTKDIEKKKLISKKIKYECYLLKKRFFRKFIEKGSERLRNLNYRDAWKFIKLRSVLRQNSVVYSNLICNDTGTEGISDNEKVRIAKKHFKKLLAETSTENKEIKTTQNNSWEMDTDQNITVEEIRIVLTFFRRYKAASRDSLPK
ncbi:hypothetical protein NUSPORA_01418 [Nucleospora cyclopteri]